MSACGNAGKLLGGQYCKQVGVVFAELAYTGGCFQERQVSDGELRLVSQSQKLVHDSLCPVENTDLMRTYVVSQKYVQVQTWF